MKYINITKGKRCIVDEDDYEYLIQYNWCAHRQRGDKYRAYRTYWDNGYIKGILMHRLIMNVDDPKIIVDHINGDPLDNRKSNLRLCSNAENLRNRGKTIQNQSGYKGVSLYRVKKYKQKEPVYMARIQYNSKQYFLGYYKSAEEAAIAYNKKALEFFGEFAKLNIIKK